MLYTSFGSLRNRVDRRLVTLQNLTVWVDEEARVASDEARDELQQFRHLELLERLPFKDTPMLLREEPFDNLPEPKNHAFFGRESELDRLKDQLKPGSSSEGLSTASLCGLGGVGKTQIALEYAYRFLRDYDHILWVSAETSLKLTDSYCTIAHDLGLADSSIQNATQLREIVKRWLLKNRKNGTRRTPSPGANVADCLS